MDIENKLNPFHEKINLLRNDIDQNLIRIKTFEERTCKQSEEFQNFQQKKVELTKELEKKNKLIHDTDEKLINIEAQIKEVKQYSLKINIDLENKTKIANNFINKISEIKTSNNEKSQKNNILDSLLKAQAEGRLKGIYGRLGDLGTIDVKYDVAISTACAALDHIVVESVDIAQKCVEYLRKYNLGRATFICLDKIAWVESKINEGNSKYNNAERLFDLVKIKNNKFINAFYFALRDTLVANDLKTASNIAYGSIRRRVVTLNGELIETSGVMSGGGKPKKGGMNSKFIEEFNSDYINQLNTDYDLVVKEIHKLKDEKFALENQFNNMNKEYNDLVIIKKKIEFDLVNYNKSIVELEKNLSSDKINKQKQTEERDKIEKLKKENSDKEISIIEIEKNSKNLKESHSRINFDINKVEGEEFIKKKDDLKVFKKKLDETERDINMMKNTVSNAADTLKKTKEEILFKEKTISQYEDLLKKNIVELKELEEKAYSIYENISKCKNESDDLGKQFDEKRKEVEELKIIIRKMKEEQDKIKGEILDYKNDITKLKKNEKTVFEEIIKNKNSYTNLIEEFGFIDILERDIKNIKNKSLKIHDNEDKIYVDNDSEEDDQSTPSINSKTKKTAKDYSKFKDPKYMSTDLVIEELEELSHSKEEILYESLLTSNELKTKQHNMDAIKVYKKKIEELKSKEDDLNNTIDKHNKCKKIFDLVKKKRFEEFMEGFNSISGRLKEMYQLITHGGDAELELLDSLDPFSEGINFSVRPYKKSWKQISNLSGGEKTLSSLSLIFALHHYKPSPLYVMDEIDAALDFKNVSIIANYIKEQTKNSQFIIISLRNHMFELANKLIGIYKTHDITKCLTFDPETCKLKSNKQIEGLEENKNENNLHN